MLTLSSKFVLISNAIRFYSGFIYTGFVILWFLFLYLFDRTFLLQHPQIYSQFEMAHISSIRNYGPFFCAITDRVHVLASSTLCVFKFTWFSILFAILNGLNVKVKSNKLNYTLFTAVKHWTLAFFPPPSETTAHCISWTSLKNWTLHSDSVWICVNGTLYSLMDAHSPLTRWWCNIFINLHQTTSVCVLTWK